MKHALLQQKSHQPIDIQLHGDRLVITVDDGTIAVDRALWTSIVTRIDGLFAATPSLGKLYRHRVGTV